MATYLSLFLKKLMFCITWKSDYKSVGTNAACICRLHTKAMANTHSGLPGSNRLLKIKNKAIKHYYMSFYCYCSFRLREVYVYAYREMCYFPSQNAPNMRLATGLRPNPALPTASRLQTPELD